MGTFKILESYLPRHPARILVCGPTMSGKTTFIKNTILHPRSPFEVLYICAHRLDQPAYCEIINTLTGRDIPVHTYTDIPEEPIKFDPSRKNVLIVDDLIAEADKSKIMGHLIRDGSHHDNITLYLVSHWVCGTGDARHQRLQMDYLCFFEFPADKKAVYAIAGQLTPGHVSRFMRLYEDATDEEFRPLIVDIKAKKHEPCLRFRCAWDVVYSNAQDL